MVQFAVRDALIPFIFADIFELCTARLGGRYRCRLLRPAIFVDLSSRDWTLGESDPWPVLGSHHMVQVTGESPILACPSQSRGGMDGHISRGYLLLRLRGTQVDNS